MPDRPDRPEVPDIGFVSKKKNLAPGKKVPDAVIRKKFLISRKKFLSNINWCQIGQKCQISALSQRKKSGTRKIGARSGNDDVIKKIFRSQIRKKIIKPRKTTRKLWKTNRSAKSAKIFSFVKLVVLLVKLVVSLLKVIKPREKTIRSREKIIESRD